MRILHTGTGSTVIAFVEDPDGYRVELIQAASTAHRA